LTEPRELAAWWCDEAAVDLRRGGHFAFRGRTVFGSVQLPPPAPAEPVDSWQRLPDGNFEVLSCEAPLSLAFRWHLLGVATEVHFDLDTHVEGSELLVTQSAAVSPAWSGDAEGPNWWWVALPALRSYIEEGKADLRVDYAEVAAARVVRFAAPCSTFPWVIWSKLTAATEIARWWAAAPEVDLRPGGVFRLGAESVGPRQVLDLEPEQRLVHDWHWGEGQVSRVAWEIEETEVETLVRVTDHGPWGPAANRERIAVHWASTLLGLIQMSEKGTSPREYQHVGL
jgi:uncharacterized protein YndB with AHSA1/START domain